MPCFQLNLHLNIIVVVIVVISIFAVFVIDVEPRTSRRAHRLISPAWGELSAVGWPTNCWDSRIVREWLADSWTLGIVKSSCDLVHYLDYFSNLRLLVISEICPKLCDNCDSWDLLVVIVEQLSELGNKGGVPGVTHSFSDPLLQGSEQKVVSL